MKNILKITAAVIAAGFLFSCNPNAGITTSAEAAKELVPLRSLLSNMEASLGLIADDDDSARAMSRTVDSGSDVSLNGKTPSEAYTDFGGTTGEVRIPNIGYFNDFDGNEGVQAYFTMEPDGDYYRIKLYTYPAVNFNVRYNYEEYLVGSGNNGTTDDWTYMDASHNPYRMISYKTYFADGSVADRTIEFTSADSDTYYSNTDLKAKVTDTIFDGNYDYDSPAPTDSSITGVDWSSKTTSVVNVRRGSDINVTEYYTEGTDSTYSGVTYMSTEQISLWGTQSKSVIRFSGDTSANTSKERSLTTIGNIGSIWYTETNRIDVSNSNGRIVYDRIQKIWYGDTDYAEGHTSSYQQNLHLEETGENTHQFTGYVEDFWGTGSTGNKFNISIGKVRSGVYKLRRFGWSLASRALDSELELDLTKSSVSDDVFVKIPVGSGEFFGYYEHGAFTGVFTASNGESFSAAIDRAGISVNGTVYTYPELY